MSLSSTQASMFTGVGIISVLAAIVGGGITSKFVTIPKVLDPLERRLLALFGGILLCLAFEVPIVVIVVLGSIAFVALSRLADNRKYQDTLIEHFHRSDLLLEDAEKAFLGGAYSWAVKYILQAKNVASDDKWQRGYAFLLGAQAAIGEYDGARKTRVEMVNSVETTGGNGTSYFCSAQNLRQAIDTLLDIDATILKRTRAYRAQGEINLALEALRYKYKDHSS